MQISLNKITIEINGQPILREFSLQVNSGEHLVLTGKSGVGKSTVLRAILGFIIPVEGSITLYGIKLDGDTIWQIRKKIAYVPQEADLGEGKVNEAIYFPFSLKANQKNKPTADRVNSLLDTFDLSPNLLGKNLSSLSSGERQRLAIIVAILQNRPLFLLDEITSHLDRENKLRVSRYFEQSNDRTIISVSHDPFQMEMADRIVHIEKSHQVPTTTLMGEIK